MRAKVKSTIRTNIEVKAALVARLPSTTPRDKGAARGASKRRFGAAGARRCPRRFHEQNELDAHAAKGVRVAIVGMPVPEVTASERI